MTINFAKLDLSPLLWMSLSILLYRIFGMDTKIILLLLLPIWKVHVFEIVPVITFDTEIPSDFIVLKAFTLKENV